MSDTVQRKKFGKHFTYQFESGKTVKNRALRRWIASLAIPPSWENVYINVDRDEKIHAYGRDQKGRKQYIYNPSWTERSNKIKFNRIARFGGQLETMRRVTSKHIKRRPLDDIAVLACMTRMLDEAFFRPGHASYTRENETYGLTTLRCKHMSIKKDTVEFDYKGKSHQQQHREVSDELVREVLIVLEKMQGYQLFDITMPDGERKNLDASDLNQYIAQVMGEDFSAKDFRTWAGTVLMAIALDTCAPYDNSSKTKKRVLECVKSVAERLGNTPTVCKSNYIHPSVILQYENGKTLSFFKKQLKNKGSKHLDIDEKATLKLIASI